MVAWPRNRVADQGLDVSDLFRDLFDALRRPTQATASAPSQVTLTPERIAERLRLRPIVRDFGKTVPLTFTAAVAATADRPVTLHPDPEVADAPGKAEQQWDEELLLAASLYGEPDAPPPVDPRSDLPALVTASRSELSSLEAVVSTQTSDQGKTLPAEAPALTSSPPRPAPEARRTEEMVAEFHAFMESRSVTIPSRHLQAVIL